jgi:hypothetical protein
MGNEIPDCSLLVELALEWPPTALWLGRISLQANIQSDFRANQGGYLGPRARLSVQTYSAVPCPVIRRVSWDIQKCGSL